MIGYFKRSIGFTTCISIAVFATFVESDPLDLEVKKLKQQVRKLKKEVNILTSFLKFDPTTGKLFAIDIGDYRIRSRVNGKFDIYHEADLVYRTNPLEDGGHEHSFYVNNDGTNYYMNPYDQGLQYDSTVPESSPTNNPATELDHKGDDYCTPLEKCTRCTGDCDSDSDCLDNLRCAQRGNHNVPGCSSMNTFSGVDFCFQPIETPGIINYIGECGDYDYLCGKCEGDCDNDSDCKDNLKCYQRNSSQSVPGCHGEGGNRDVTAKDICYDPNDSPTSSPTPFNSGVRGGKFEKSLTYKGPGSCNISQPCQICEGTCSVDSDCDNGLSCFQRTLQSPIPGCVTGGAGDVNGANYCYEKPANGPVSYVPGDLSVEQNGLRLSKGLSSKIIARTGNVVEYTGGVDSIRIPSNTIFHSNVGIQSNEIFHKNPDGAAVFKITDGSNAGGWIYVSNSEASDGGVGAITFDANGNVIDYKRIVTGTSRNCGGGKTYWGTWVTCEENGSAGQVYESDPHGIKSPMLTVLGGTGGNYESFAYDARDKLKPTFYVTNDKDNGSLTRFTPDPVVVRDAENSGDYSKVLTTMGTLEWLILTPSLNDPETGTFQWTSNRDAANENAAQHYQDSEGIDIRNGYVYFTCKTDKHLFILDLDNFNYKRSSTQSGAFNNQPDQVARIVGDSPGSNFLYFCEDGGNDCGVHARDSDGYFYSILDGPSYDTETTGLAFSPDNMHMYVSFQRPGIIFDITRDDGYPFGGQRLDIKYHQP